MSPAPKLGDTADNNSGVAAQFFAAMAGKSIVSRSPPFCTLKSPREVEKRTSPSWGLTKRNKTKAAARVAWPQSFSSQTGENQRNAYPVDEGTRNAVAGRLFSLATLRRRASSNQK